MSIRKADTPARERKEWILVMKKHGIVISEILSAVLVSGMAVMPAFADVPETAAPASSIQVYTGHTYEMEWSRDAGRYLAESICPQAGLDERTEERYPELGRAFRELNEKKRKEFGEKYQEILEDAKERYQENPEYTGTFSDAESWYVQRADGHIVSLLGVHSGYIGGVHGYEGFSGMSYDPVSGKELKLSELVTDAGAFQEIVREGIYSSYSDVEEDLVERYFANTAMDEMTWTAGYEGITCYFDAYTLGPYASGYQTFLVPYEGNETLFAQAAADAAQDYGTEFPSDHSMKIGGRKICVWENRDYQTDSINGVTIVLDGEKYDFDDTVYGYAVSPAYLKTDGEEYLYIQYSSDNDYRLFDIYRLGETPERIGESYLARAASLMEDESFTGYAAMSDPENLLFSTRTELLGTVDGQRLYRVGADGRPEEKEPYLHIMGERILTTKEELPCEEVDEEGNLIGSLRIPARTKLTLLRTDDEAVVDLRMEDGRIARVQVSAMQYPHSIDGRSIEEIFDGIVFAG